MGRQVVGVPALAEGRGVRTEGVEQVAQLGALGLGEGHKGPS